MQIFQQLFYALKHTFLTQISYSLDLESISKHAFLHLSGRISTAFAPAHFSGCSIRPFESYYSHKTYWSYKSYKSYMILIGDSINAESDLKKSVALRIYIFLYILIDNIKTCVGTKHFGHYDTFGGLVVFEQGCHNAG